MKNIGISLNNYQKDNQNLWKKYFLKLLKKHAILYKKILIFDFNKRMTSEEALKHPYLSELHLPEDEPIREKILLSEFEFETYKKLTR